MSLVFTNLNPFTKGKVVPILTDIVLSGYWEEVCRQKDKQTDGQQTKSNHKKLTSLELSAQDYRCYGLDWFYVGILINLLS